MLEMQRNDIDWRGGRASLHVYYAGEDVLQVARDAYAMFLSENALAPAAFPSLAAMERDLVDASLDLFHAPPDAVGNLTSGGTESIFLAVKAARDWGAHQRSKWRGGPELVLSRTAHPAFDKAAQFLGVKVVRVPTAHDYGADVAALAAAVSDRTIMIVASAPTFPYGSVDPVREIARVAQDNDIWFHVDACVGGFLAPFARTLGYNIPDFDFAVPGVRSISADLHKYGYAAKGASLILYSHADFQRYQSTEFSDWPKGKYFTPTFAGTRPGGAIAAAWAVMHYLGESGYLHLASRVMKTWQKYLTGIAEVPELAIVGKPHLAVVAFTSRVVDIFSVAQELKHKGWYVSRLAEPTGIHQMVNVAHEPIVEQYLSDLTMAVGRAYDAPLSEWEEVVTY